MAMSIDQPYYLIIDVEATCDDRGTVPRDEMEIIEIGAVLQNARTFEVESEFQTFVHPVRHPQLTMFCMELTRIHQSDVEHAPGYEKAIGQLVAWRKEFPPSLFCSWGNYDRGQFQQDCTFHRVAYPFHEGHLNLKAEFSRGLGTRKQFGMAGALRRLGLQLEGTHHRAIDDVRNIARIVRRVCAGV
jgi:inhibitor of KinA sporulation pathway (predicted exonuclease)